MFAWKRSKALYFEGQKTVSYLSWAPSCKDQVHQGEKHFLGNVVTDNQAESKKSKKQNKRADICTKLRCKQVETASTVLKSVSTCFDHKMAALVSSTVYRVDKAYSIVKAFFSTASIFYKIDLSM